jgi:hypothetical protein
MVQDTGNNMQPQQEITNRAKFVRLSGIIFAVFFLGTLWLHFVPNRESDPVPISAALVYYVGPENNKQKMYGREVIAMSRALEDNPCHKVFRAFLVDAIKKYYSVSVKTTKTGSIMAQLKQIVSGKEDSNAGTQPDDRVLQKIRSVARNGHITREDLPTSITIPGIMQRHSRVWNVTTAATACRYGATQLQQ